jgi:hypothetical protein
MEERIWICPSDHQGKIQRIYYLYSMDVTPPVYYLYISFKNGFTKAYSSFKESDFDSKEDLLAFRSVKSWPLEIPVPIPSPVSKERSQSCCVM